MDNPFEAVIFIGWGLLVFVIVWTLIIPPAETEGRDISDFNGSLYVSPPPKPVEVICPEAPEVTCTANCKSYTRWVEACNLPDRYFSRPSTAYVYTGSSNIPSIFMGNKIVTVEVESKKDLFVGCFYGFYHEGSLKVHRLQAIYPDYLVFQGDNSGGVEKVGFEDVEYLVRGILFK